jgi:hypothetical protein
MAFQLGRLNECCRSLCADRAVFDHCRTNFATYVAISLALSFIVASPALWCGLIGDDIINALTPEWVQTTYGSLYRLIFDTALSWAAIGRLYPISIAVTYTVWNYAYYDPAYAKLISLMGYLVCLGVTADFIRRFTTSARAALFFILITTVCVQFRAWYDAILCFPLLVPLTLTIVMLQASLLHSYLKSGSQWHLCLALAALAVGLLTYELAIVALPIDLSILWAARACHKQKLSILATIAGLFLAYLLLRIALRVPGATVYEGTAISLDATKFMRALAINLFAAFPLTNLPLNPELVFRERSLVDLLTISTISAAVGVLFYLAWRRFTRLGQTGFINVSAMLLIGAFLLVVPAAMLALSVRYQNLVTKFGDVYIQALFEEIGLGILAACGINMVLTRAQPASRVWHLSAGALALICTITFVNNVFVVSALNEWADKIGRRAFVESMRNGILNAVPNGSLLVFEGHRVWADPRLVHLFSGKLVSVKSGALQEAELRCYSNAFLIVISNPLRRSWLDRDLQAAVSISRVHQSSEPNYTPGLPLHAWRS